MRIREILLVLVALLLTAASTNLRAEDFCTGNMMLASYAASGAVPAPASPAPASPAATSCAADGCGCGCGCGCGDCDPSKCFDPSKCCDCCGPGTNPWDGTVKAGFGLRSSYNFISAQSPAAPGILPTQNSNDFNFFNPDDMRIYLSGSAFGGLVKGTLNTEVTGDGLPGSGSFVAPNNVTNVALLDGIAQFEFNDKVNFWTGRFLPPTDRANLDGPFYQTPYDYPFVSNYPSLLAGRDDGVAYWGQAGGGKLKWQMGLFNGVRYTLPGGIPVDPNADGNLFIIGRITVNLLDPEPGYYTQSCYFGDKEILAVGITGAFQRDAGGNGTTNGDFCAGSIDLLWEHRLGNCGVIDVESAFYKYNYDVSAAEAAAGPGAGNVAAYDTAIANQGTSEYVQISYMLPNDYCFGRLSGRMQPFTRYQYYGRDFRAEAAGLSSLGGPLFYEGVDVGVNYIISGYNARTTIAWEQRNAEGAITYDLLRVGVQLQY